MARRSGAIVDLSIMLCETIGVDPSLCLGLDLKLRSNGVASLTILAICTDEAGKAITENDALKTELRTWKEQPGG